MAEQVASGILEAAQPFDLAQTLWFIGMFGPTMGEQKLTSQSLTKAFQLHGRTVAFSLAEQEHQLHYQLYADQPLDESEQREVVEAIRFYLSLDDDLRPFYAVGEQDASFAPVIQRLYGLHQVKFSLTAFENVCWAVLTQRNPIPIARKVKDRLVEAIGGSISVEGVQYRAFPDPSRVVGLSDDELNSLIRNERKANYVRGIARAFDSVDEHWLRTGDYDDVEAWLRNIKGIGDWSAGFILLRGLGRMERFPTDEKHLLTAASRLYGREMTPEALEQMGRLYGAQRGYWAYYARVAG